MFTRALRHARTSRRLRRLAPVGVSLVLIAAPLALQPVGAGAAATTTLSGSPFNGSDGILDTNGSIGAHDDVGTPDTFAGGVKEDTDCPPMDGGGAPDKSDVLTGWVGNANGVVSGVNHTFLYLAWSRPSDEGTATIDFELNSGSEPCGTGSSFVKRVAGQDLLFTYDFQGGNTIGVVVRTWLSSGGGKWSDPTVIPATKAEASISGSQLFGEAAIDMTAAGFFQPGVCRGFSSATVKSRSSSSSFQNQVKDLILPFPVQVTNCGSLTVTKTVVGGAGESFSFTVDCGSVDLNGTAGGDDLTFSLADGGSRKVDDIPLGSVCSVTETDPGGARWTTTHRVDTGGTQSSLTASDIAIALGNKTVAFTNTRKVGNLIVSKVTTGGTGTFTFHVDCTGSAYDQDVTITNSGSQTITGIPTETECSVTEVSNPLFTSTRLPENGTVTIDTNGETVSFTNVRNVGDLTIQKTTTGGTGTFSFIVNCDGTDFDRTVTITNSGSRTIEDIPTGTSCTVTEVADPLFTSTPASRTAIIDANGETVSFINVRKVGDLTIEKTTLGGTGTFTFDVNCDGTGFDRRITITDSGSHTIQDIPTGTNCTVSEVADPLFTSSPATTTVTIDDDGATASFLNVRKTAGLTISKLTTGGTGTFTFDVDCDVTGFDQAVTITNTGTVTIVNIPTGTTCRVTERANQLFTSSRLPSDGEVTIDDDGETVSFTNVRNTGSLTVSKTTNGGFGTFTFDVNCTDDAFDQTLTITDSDSRTITGIPTETECTVSEDPDILFTSSRSPLNGTVSIDADGETVAFTNTAKPNGISIDKKVNGEDTSAGDPLAVEVGSILNYTVKVTNSGQVPLSIDELTDTLKSDVGATCVPSVETPLDPGESVTCSYTMTADDPGGASIIHNTATVTGIDVFNRSAGPEDDETWVHVLNPAIHLDKTGPAQAHVGDTITYTLTVTNPGNTPLDITDWDDDICDGEPVLSSKEGADNRLDPGETWAYNCSHVVLAGDPDRLVNTATVTGTDDLEKDVTSTDDAVTTILRPAISITKTGLTNAHVGDPVVYTLLVTNNGNTPLSSVTVTDPKCDGLPVRSDTDADGLLSPGQSWTYNCTHLVVVGDGASILNTATAEGTDPLGETVDSTDDHVAVVLHPAISIVKTANPEAVSVSGPVTYTYVVTTTGDTMLVNVTVTDDVLGAIGSVGELAVGESVTMTKTVQVDASTPPRNIGTAVGTDILGQTVLATDDAVITVVLAAVAELPRTGSPLDAQTRAAIMLIEVGVFMTLAGRRRRAGRRAD